MSNQPRKYGNAPDMMRQVLLSHGLYPSQEGARMAELSLDDMRQDVHQMVDRLETADLFSVLQVVGALTGWPAVSPELATKPAGEV